MVSWGAYRGNVGVGFGIHGLLAKRGVGVCFAALAMTGSCCDDGDDVLVHGV